MTFPMQSLCGAHARTTGEPCRGAAMANGRCRMHGGKSTGRSVISGEFTKNAVAQRKQLRKLIRDMKELIG
jgi:hypothetical protein